MPNCSASQGRMTCRYAYTAMQQVFVVPASVTSVEVSAVGAPGGAAAGNISGEAGIDGAGGDGAAVTGQLSVIPGEMLYAIVGGPGGSSSCAGYGGFNGGGAGGGDCGTGGGGGGGASDVQTCPLLYVPQCGSRAQYMTSKLLVAGGGGGGGAAGDSDGGAGGGANPDGTGSAGESGSPIVDGAPGGGGGGGTLASGGAGGTSAAVCSGGEGGSVGQAFMGGEGGVLGSGSGGGGGGYYGGGGGGPGGRTSCGSSSGGSGGGGGGSSYGPPGMLVTQDATGVPSVAFSYAVTPPLITSAPATTFAPGTAGSFTVTTTGFPTPSVQLIGILPAWLSFVDHGDGTATISGTPPAGTTTQYSWLLDAANGAPPNASQDFDLTVGSGLPSGPPSPGLPSGPPSPGPPSEPSGSGLPSGPRAPTSPISAGGGALSAGPVAGAYLGRTSQPGKRYLVRFSLISARVVKNMRMTWRARCTSGRVLIGETKEATTEISGTDGVLRASSGYRTSFARASHLRDSFRVLANRAQFPDRTHARGAFRITVWLYDGRRHVDSCDTGLVHWTASHNG
ncbi:MAG: Ig domain-containing protein [Solirubrobacteraceae bacterium]